MAKEKSAKAAIFLDPLLKANPLFVMVLGTCPALAVTSTLENALGMGLLFTFVLFFSNLLVSTLRKVIPDEVRTPSYIVIIATFVTIVEMLTKTFLPELYSSLGVFVSLLVVNCIVLGRAEAFASKNTVADSMLDALGNGLGYTWAIMSIGLVREVLGTGTLTIGKTFSFLVKDGKPLVLPILSGFEGSDFSAKIPLFASNAGGFLVLGIALAIVAAIGNAKIRKEREKAKAAAAAAKAAALAAKGGN